MKLPAILLAAITTAVVVSSCTKGVDIKPDKPGTAVDTANGGCGPTTPDYCPACGMG